LISWIRGELIQSWLKNQKFFVLINCQGIGYEIQTSFLLEKDLKSETTLWLHHIKREDSESFYGFRNKDERDFFRDLLNVKGIGPQIGMALFNKYSLNEVINALMTNDQRLINSVPGIGQKMTERIFLELKNKIKFKECNLKQTNKSTEIKNNELTILIQDIKIALDSLDFPKKDIQKTIDLLQIDLENDIKKLKSENKINFEYLFKKSLNFLENN
tara:strand:- start:6 stop:653 length:648 start_codon:yes stop_codon:yes gene_type:complete